MKCQHCGKYNDPGNGGPDDGPASRKHRKQWEAKLVERGTA
jgi:hypothetical protein